MKLTLRLVEHFLTASGYAWSAKELQLRFQVSRRTIHFHLKKLKDGAIIIKEDKGYRLHPRFIQPVMEYNAIIKREQTIKGR